MNATIVFQHRPDPVALKEIPLRRQKKRQATNSGLVKSTIFVSALWP